MIVEVPVKGEGTEENPREPDLSTIEGKIAMWRVIEDKGDKMVVEVITEG